MEPIDIHSYCTNINEKLEIFEEKVIQAIDNFRTNAKTETLKQMNLFQLYKTKNFPSDRVADNQLRGPFTDRDYECFGTTCHATALAIVEYFKENRILKNTPSFAFRQNECQEENTGFDFEEICNLPLSVNRILLKPFEYSGFHEFVIIKLATQAFLIQSNMWTRMEVTAPLGKISLKDDDMFKVFSNDTHILQHFFGLSDQITPKIEIVAFDHYPMKNFLPKK